MTEKRSARSPTRPCPPLVRGQWSSDEYSRECLAIRVDRKLNSGNVIDALSDLFILRGVPSFIRSDNGPEFIAQAVQDWIKAVGARTAYIEPGSPWENRYCESFNARFRDEFPQWRDILQPARSPNPDRKMEETRQHETTTQCFRLPPTGPRNHRPDGPKANHALTIKLDHQSGADQPTNSIRISSSGATDGRPL